MAVFKCKMCGAPLEIQGNETVISCEYCYTRQTLPKLDSDKKSTLYDRAGHFRRNNDYDKASAIYEQILNEDPSDAEAYWSLILCRFGIEYVEDPATKKRIPTVNRAQYTSVFDDDNYKSALQYADPMQRSLYEEEAAAINEIQRGILSISQKEEPFDVFICYKETASDGRRTPDSVLANDLYHQLTQEGFKVFYAAITLEDKLGSAYEPYIFAAIHSAKVMVVLGTKPEYFNAVWVKNEWSRFLALIRGGEKKLLIPAYKDMDPYDLPEEFAHLQAQDMSKLGFMQDLIRGIKKITGKTEPAPAAPAASSAAGGVTSMLKRAFLFLEDRDWTSANDYCEKVLDIDPECAKAYYYKLMAELKISEEAQLMKVQTDLTSFANYKKALRYGDARLVTLLREAADASDANRKGWLYEQAITAFEGAKNQEEYNRIREQFRRLGEFRDAPAYATRCEKAIENCHKEQTYQKAMALLQEAKEDSINEAKRLFFSLSDYRDSVQQMNACNRELERLQEEKQRYVSTIIDRVYDRIREGSFADAAKLATESEALVPQNVRIPIAKLLINYKVKDENQLAKQPVRGGKTLSENPYFQKIMELGDYQTVQRYEAIEKKMQAVKRSWRVIGWILGILFLILSPVPVSWIRNGFKVNFLTGALLMAAPMILYLLLTFLVKGKNRYQPGDYFMSFSMLSVVTDLIVMFVTGSANRFFHFLLNKVAQFVVWIVGVCVLDFESYTDLNNPSDSSKDA